MPDETPKKRTRNPVVIPDERPAKIHKIGANLTAAQKQAKDEALKASYAHAQQQLRTNHLPEFNDIRVDAMARLGFEWKPEPTEKEKALADFEKLLALHPDFAERVQARQEAADAAAAAAEEKATPPAEGQSQPDDPTAPGMRGVG